MEEKKQISLSPEIESFISNFVDSGLAESKISAENDKTVSSAVIYEKIRTSLEYQEEHLIFKNAIARILRRRYTLGLNSKAQDLYTDLISELGWSDYVNPEVIKPEQQARIIEITERYLVFLKSVQSGYISKNDLTKMIVNWQACEIDEVFHPVERQDTLLDFVSNSLSKGLQTDGLKITEDESEMQLKIAAYALIIKPDYHSIEYWVLRKTYPDWQKLSLDEIRKIARSFDPYYNKVSRVLNHPLHRDFHQFAKRNITPYILLYWVLVNEKINQQKIIEKPQALQNLMMQYYEKSISEVRQKVWRGTYRALIFILLTKISLAFIIEIPFDHYFAGEINYLTLLINIFTPPLLMLIAGTFVKSPPASNYKNVTEATANLISKNNISDRKAPLVKKKNGASSEIFNYLYLFFTVAILVLTIKILIYLGFNFVSIILFFVFVSAVSFFSFRIRSMALELAMKRTKDDALTSTLEFIFLPFIRIGKYLTDRLATFNPFILALDFLIEAPLKSIIKIVNSWLKFVNAKKEDLEY